MSQMIKFAIALKDIAQGKEATNYNGEYTKRLALELAETTTEHDSIEEWAWRAIHRVVAEQKQSLQNFDVKFDTWAFESSMHLGDCINELRKQSLLGQAYKLYYDTPAKESVPICGLCGRRLEFKKTSMFSKDIKPCLVCITAFSETLLGIHPSNLV